MKFLSYLLFNAFVIFPALAYANCNALDKSCVMDEIYSTSLNIKEDAWRDKALRELAKSYTYENNEAKALSLISEIKKPDTKAMTIRGIGFAAADNGWGDRDRYNKLFKNLAMEAQKIDHPPSYAIAMTYIAMAQAFAKDDKGAMQTAKSMENKALRNKAFAESAEIQAERNDFDAAIDSLSQIEDISYQNKAYGTVAHIFTKKGNLNKAYVTANKINNPYAKTQALQKIVNFGNKEEMVSESYD